MRAWTRAGGEGGQVLPFVALIVLVVGGAVIVVGHLGRLAVDRARARTAADAAALAGAGAGRPAAEEVSHDNRAVLEDYVADKGVVEVRVRVGDSRATARAERTGNPSGAGRLADVAPQSYPGRHPPMDQSPARFVPK
jgi:Putative Flp pilus-assembly TadE/G-like